MRRQAAAWSKSLVRRTKAKGISGDWDGRARKIVTSEVAPALQRQIEELKAERATATDIAGMWSRPHGDEYYNWTLRASTTTDMTPDQVHQMGLEQLNELQGRMDPILKSLGYTQGSVGERMQALGKDPRYKFSEGDKGRAEIMAFIQQRIARRARAAARVQHARSRPSGGEADSADGGGRCSRRLRRRRLDRRQDPGQILDQSSDHRPPSQVRPA